MEYKQLRVHEVKADPFSKTVYGYAATWDLDTVDDEIEPGAFVKTIKTRHDARIQAGRASSIKMLWQHDSTRPVGLPITLKEDSNGLYLAAMMSDTQLGRETLTQLIDGTIDCLSIGYVVTRYIMKGHIRVIQEIELYEISYVTFPANENALITGVKSLAPVIIDGVKVETKDYAVRCSVVKNQEDTNVNNEVKAGRMLSQATADKLIVAVNTIQGILGDAGFWTESQSPDLVEKPSEHESTDSASVPSGPAGNNPTGVDPSTATAGTHSPTDALGYQGTSYDPQRIENPANYHKSIDGESVLRQNASTAKVCPTCQGKCQKCGSQMKCLNDKCDQCVGDTQKNSETVNEKKGNNVTEDNSDFNEILKAFREYKYLGD